jgi:hypothetical protein
MQHMQTHGVLVWTRILGLCRLNNNKHRLTQKVTLQHNISVLKSKLIQKEVSARIRATSEPIAKGQFATADVNRGKS